MPYEIIHKRDGCIGCGACAAACPEFWEMGSDGKSTLKGNKGNKLKLDEPGCNKEAADACPVGVIEVKKV
ncbi:MAG: ferredoxin [Candidatus Aenigmatarchaeota archaeon]